MSTLCQSILILVGSAIFSVGGFMLTRKLVGAKNLENHHELASNILAVVGTLNAVLLGLVILEAQSRFQQARTNEAAESSAIGDMRMYAEYLPEPTRGLINKHVGTYVKLVRDVEWDSPPAMQPNQEAVREYHCLWKLVCEYNPTTSKEQNLQASMLTSLTQSFDLRRFRITTGRHGLPTILWSVLIVGSISTIVFTYFLAGRTLKMHVFMVALLSLPLSMGILVVYVLGNPYVGDWKIRPEQFMRISTGPLPITSNSKP
ncbi:MAG: DUF4239 domain-containing protein [Cyanobacteria bacterium REEB67]|nr:DUF4239 domain-containing protein [Cyanobacteria bacterium REEB67]